MQVLAKVLTRYVSRQLSAFFPDDIEYDSDLFNAVTISLKELKECFSYINVKYFIGDFEKTFNYLNGDHYSMFLYKLSYHAFYQSQNEALASKLFGLNRGLHGIDAFYKIKLPTVFLFSHPVGTVLGNGVYSDFFAIHQNCTIGSRVLGVYPVMKGRTILYSNATLIGEATLGNNVILASGATVIDQEIPDNKTVIGVKPNQVLKNSDLYYFDWLFKKD